MLQPISFLNQRYLGRMPLAEVIHVLQELLRNWGCWINVGGLRGSRNWDAAPNRSRCKPSIIHRWMCVLVLLDKIDMFVFKLNMYIICIYNVYTAQYTVDLFFSVGNDGYKRMALPKDMDAFPGGGVLRIEEVDNISSFCQKKTSNNWKSFTWGAGVWVVTVLIDEWRDNA